MALQASTERAEVRRTAEFHPSVWGDYFINKVSRDEVLLSAWSEKAEVLKEEVRKMLRTCRSSDEPSQKLHLIDVCLRLGIGYLFEAEINEALEQVYNTYHDYKFDEDLFTVALRFRLLRQHGYNVSSDVFNNFKDGGRGKFKENLIMDAKGLLSLYEASFLGFHGEDILDEALTFCKIQLESMVIQLASSPLAEQVSHALKRPIRKGVEKHEQWHYISSYQQDEARVEPVLMLAKLNFNILQKLYQDELKVISEWWIDLDFAKKLPFARDRLIEIYFWALGVYTEPQFVLARRFLTKICILVSVMDDMYDNHGTIEELELFTETIERWDSSSTKELPDYMRVYYEGLIGVIEEIEEETTKEGRQYCEHYLKEMEKMQARAYLTEARWFNQGYVPTLEEYRRNGVYTSNFSLISAAGFCGMGKLASKVVFEWLFNDPKILEAAADLCRLMDDIKTHEFEQKRGHVASSVECYIKQYGVGKEEAHEKLNKIVESDWKDINEELLKPAAVPKQVLTVYLNMARVMDVIYKDFDGYTNAGTETKDMLAALLVNPLPI